MAPENEEEWLRGGRGARKRSPINMVHPWTPIEAPFIHDALRKGVGFSSPCGVAWPSPQPTELARYVFPSSPHCSSATNRSFGEVVVGSLLAEAQMRFRRREVTRASASPIFEPFIYILTGEARQLSEHAFHQ